jgi:hypothetical protein
VGDMSKLEWLIELDNGDPDGRNVQTGGGDWI